MAEPSLAPARPDVHTDHALRPLMEPRRVAIVGASSDVSRTAGRPARYLREHGFTGEVWVVNPRGEPILGYPCARSVADLPWTPDVGLIVLGAERVETAVRELAERGTPYAIVLSGGYAEVDAAGRQRQDALRQAAAKGGLRLLGPNSMGVVNVRAGATLSPSGALEVRPLQPGRIGLVSQSGGVMGALLSRATARGVGFSKLVATGNEADLDVLDAMNYLLQDDETTVIALYLEGLRNPARFRALAGRAAALGKPVVVHKVGRSEAGARSAISHTGALAGSDELYEAFFAQVGVIRTRAFTDLIDVAAALASGRRLAGPRLAILTSTGGAGVLVADACGTLGLEAPAPDAATAARLAEIVSGEGVAPDRNPFDVTLAGARSDVFSAATAALLDSPSYDGMVVVVGATSLANPDVAAGPIVASQALSQKPLLAYVSPYAPDILRRLNQQGVPTFDTPEGLAAAAAALLSSAARPSAAAPAAPSSHTAAPAADGLPPAGTLNEVEAAGLLARFGISTAFAAVAATPAEAAERAAEFGQPVVLKVLSRDLPHKSDVGGVRVGVAPEYVAQAAAEMLAGVRQQRPDVRIDGLLVQAQTAGVEMLVGVRRDPQLGAAIVVGAGGTTAELLGDTAVRIAPVSLAEARAMLASLKSAPLLHGYRGRPPADIEALARTIVAFSDMALALGDRLLEAEVNPLFVLPAGQGVRAADALVVLA